LRQCWRDQLRSSGYNHDTLSSAALRVRLGVLREQAEAERADLTRLDALLERTEHVAPADLATEVEQAEVALVPELLRTRQERLTREAVRATLEQLGLRPQETTDAQGRTTLIGRGSAGETVEVTVEADAVVTSVEVPENEAHPLNPPVDDICWGSVELTQRVHVELQQQATERGLPLGRIESLARPVRKATRATGSAATSATEQHQGGAR
jgi:hypothetical protein